MFLKTYSASSLDEALKCAQNELGDDITLASCFTQNDQTIVTVIASSDQELALTSPLLPHEYGWDQFWSDVRTQHFSDAQLTHAAQLLLPHQGLALPIALEQLAQQRFKNIHLHEHSAWIFMGPPGIGKTLTLAKMANALQKQGKFVHIIAADTLKTGAHEYTLALAKALNLTCTVIQNPFQLMHVMPAAHIDHVTLIDTSGVNLHLEEDRQVISAFLQQQCAHPCLVLSAEMHPLQVQHYLAAFEKLGVNTCVISRIDLASRITLSLVLLFCAQHDVLHLLGYTDSPFAQDPLRPLSSDKLIQLYFQHLI